MLEDFGDGMGCKFSFEDLFLRRIWGLFTGLRARDADHAGNQGYRVPTVG